MVETSHDRHGIYQRRHFFIVLCVVFTGAVCTQHFFLRALAKLRPTRHSHKLLPAELQNVSGPDDTEEFSRDVTCIEPGLPRGAFHVVIAGWDFVEHFADHYLWDLGLTNALFVLYRRTRPELPPRIWKGPCGMRGQEVVMLPNRGLEASAFYDYLIKHFDNPPLGLAFLHGHAAISWHTSCEAVLSRVFLYYNKVHDADEMDTPNMLTLTSKSDGRNMKPFEWFGGRKLLDSKLASSIAKRIETLNLCKAILSEISTRGNNITQFVGSAVHRPETHSCCASFVLKGAKFGQIKLQVLQNLKALTMGTDVEQKVAATHCFEFIVYAMYGDDSTSVALTWYLQAEAILPKIKQTTAFVKCSRERAGHIS